MKMAQAGIYDFYFRSHPSRRLPRLTSVTCFVAILLLAPFGSFAELTKEQQGDLLSLVRSKEPISEKRAESLVSKLGADAVPVLLAEVKNAEQPLWIRGRAAFCLGKFGAEESVKPLIEFFEQNAHGRLHSVNLAGVRCALLALGFVGSPQALSYLEKVAQSDYWDKCADGPILTDYPGNDEMKAVHDLRQGALSGLGAAGSQQSLDILERLRAAGDTEMPTWEGYVDGAQKDCTERMNKRANDSPPASDALSR